MLADTDGTENTSSNPHIRDIIQQAFANPTRRSFLKGSSAFLTAATGATLAGCASGDDDVFTRPTALTFEAVPKNTLDKVTLPPGYQFTVLHGTGDRLVSSIPAYSNKGTETDDWSQRVGDHHDGIELFHLDSAGKYTKNMTDRALLCMNHESSADAHFFHPNGQTSNGVSGKKYDQFGQWDLGTRPGLEALKEINHHGVSIVEINRGSTGWTYKLDSAFNRRITPQTVCRVAGPAAELNSIKALFTTRFDTTGATARGTINNCGTGYTPWGTFLTCEENWATYFAMPKGSQAPDARMTQTRARYGVRNSATAATATTANTQGWHTVTDQPDTAFRFSRWDVSIKGATERDDFRNEPQTFGYIVEIDPTQPNSQPVKRVAMGRTAHEACVFGKLEAGKPVTFYMGCDSRNEYIYKWVSTKTWDPADFGGGTAAGDKYLNDGKLYVAKFAADGTGMWLELSITNPAIANYATFKFNNQAEIYVFTRLAADAVGATKMDRPEWGAVNPANGEIYFALTNNNSTNRNPNTTDAANPRSYADPDGRMGSGNPNGHIIRFKESSTGLTFQFDIFLFGSEEDNAASNISKLTAKNSFSSPDGLWFSKATGLCWIQTDDGAYTDEVHCMLLVAIPGQVGDGKAVTITNTLSGATKDQATFVGAELGETKLRRFLTGPAGCEITGIAESADGRTIFVNVQHPGENTTAAFWSGTAPESQWPGNAGYGVTGRPRSATLVITKVDGGLIGV
jgi:secreted PhoX family phosphatase